MPTLEIKTLDNGIVEARGFVLEASPNNMVLYPEPKLKSCCRGVNLEQGLLLSGNVPKNSIGKCVTLVGKLEDKRLSILEGPGESQTLWPFFLLFTLLLVVIKIKGSSAEKR